MPSNRLPRIADIQIKVMPALRLLGSRKAGMPLEIASTPVSAVVPLENARKIRNNESACALWSISMGGGSVTMPRLPARNRPRPTATVMNIIVMKK